MTVKRALVCDDRIDRVEGWRETLLRRLSGWEVTNLTAGGDLANFVAELGEHEQRVRQGTSVALTGDHATLANDCGLILIDADLSPSRQDLRGVPSPEVDDVVSKLRNQSGDAIARQVRSYTTANAIVVVNMFHPRHRNGRVFDLTLMQQTRTHADAHVSAAELDDDTLWAWDPPDRRRVFDPWYRDVLPELADVVDRSNTVMADLLDEPVLQTLGIDAAQLVARQLDVFGSADPADATFRQLATGQFGLPYPDEMATDDAAAARMAASVVRRWLARVLLPAQNVIVDAPPHLVARFPRLGPEAATADEWDKTTAKQVAGEPLSAAAPARASALDAFVTRPTYFAEVARQIQRERDSAPDLGGDDLVFAEDTSRFIPRAEGQEFESDVAGNYATRWIENLEDDRARRDEVSYEPFTRLL